MQLRCGRDRPWLANAPVAHAEVARLDDHRHAVRAEGGVDGVRNLRRELFLNLQTLRVDVHDARELGESDDTTIRDVCHMRLPNKRHHVVLAVAVHFDVLQEHEFVVPLDLTEGAQ